MGTPGSHKAARQAETTLRAALGGALAAAWEAGHELCTCKRPGGTLCRNPYVAGSGRPVEGGPGWEAYLEEQASLRQRKATIEDEPEVSPFCAATRPSEMREGYTYRCVKLRGHEGPHNSGNGQWEDEEFDAYSERPPSCRVSWCSLPAGHVGSHEKVRGEDLQPRNEERQ